MPPSLRVFLFGLLLIGLLILLSGVAIKSAQKCDVAIESNNNNRMELSKLAARMTALEEKVENTLLKEEEKGFIS
jgi:hypothetical protein